MEAGARAVGRPLLTGGPSAHTLPRPRKPTVQPSHARTLPREEAACREFVMSDMPEPFVPVTLTAIYHELQGVSAKIDALSGMPARIEKLEDRQRKQEIASAYYVTKSQLAAVFGSFLGVVVAACSVLGLILAR